MRRWHATYPTAGKGFGACRNSSAQVKQSALKWAWKILDATCTWVPTQANSFATRVYSSRQCTYRANTTKIVNHRFAPYGPQIPLCISVHVQDYGYLYRALAPQIPGRHGLAIPEKDFDWTVLRGSNRLLSHRTFGIPDCLPFRQDERNSAKAWYLVLAR